MQPALKESRLCVIMRRGQTMQQEKRDSMEVEIRKNRISLVTLGTGIMFFGGWSVVRGILYFWAQPSYFSDLDEDPESAMLILVFSWIIIGVILLFDLFLHIYIGRAARAEGKGEQPKKAYLIFAGVILVINAAAAFFSLNQVITVGLESQSGMEFAASLLMDFTSSGMMAELLVTAKRLRKQQAEMGE